MNSPLQRKDGYGRSMLRGYNGKMRPSAWARLSDAPTTSAPRTSSLWWLLWGEVEILVVEAEVGEGGDGNHCEVIDVAGWI